MTARRSTSSDESFDGLPLKFRDHSRDRLRRNRPDTLNWSVLPGQRFVRHAAHRVAKHGLLPVPLKASTKQIKNRSTIYDICWWLIPAS